jgi:hypothetical protein
MMNNWILTKIRAKKPEKEVDTYCPRFAEVYKRELRRSILDNGKNFNWEPFGPERAFSYCPTCFGLNVLNSPDGSVCVDCHALVVPKFVNKEDYQQLLRDNGR